MCSVQEGERWQLSPAKVESRSKASMGGKERCEAKVRQMVADNEDVAMQGGCRGEAERRGGSLSSSHTHSEHTLWGKGT